MAFAALFAWLLTAVGGFYLLGTWIAKGGHRGSSHLPPPVIFSHFGLAAAGLVVWIIYLITDNNTLAWVGLLILVPVAALGFGMLARWLPTHRARGAVPAGRGAAAGDTATHAVAERHFPVAVVGAHGLFAVVTVVLVLLSALGVGGS
jgi:hypothetical protein